MTAVLTPDNRIDEMERVIREALRQSMPASIVSTDASGPAPVLGEPVRGVPPAEATRARSDAKELAAAKNPVSTSPH